MSIYYRGGYTARIQRAVNQLFHSFYIDVEPDPSRSVFVCGSGRSGTSWLADLLNHSNRYRYLYEPFNCAQVSLCRAFSPRQYLRSDDDDPRYLLPAQLIFSGRIRNPWIDQYNKRVVAQRRLVKDVRSMLMLKWVRLHFPDMPIVFIVRHPCAVALSRVRRAPMADRRKLFLDQEMLVADHLAPFMAVIEKASTPFERHLIGWCIENFVPMAQLSTDDVYLLFYENLCIHPQEELFKLFTYLKQPSDPSVLKILHKPSTTSNGNSSNVSSSVNFAEAWRAHISAEEMTTARRIIDTFGLDEIYGNSSLPDAQKAQQLLKKPKALPQQFGDQILPTS